MKKKILSAYNGINKATKGNGFARRTVSAYCGKTASGKTTILLTEALKMATNGNKVLFVPSEMGSLKVIDKLLKISNEINIKTPYVYTLHEIAVLNKKCKGNIFISDRIGNLKELENNIKEIKPDVLIFDNYYYFSHLCNKVSPEERSTWEISKKVIEYIVSLSNKYNMATIIDLQLNNSGIDEFGRINKNISIGYLLSLIITIDKNDFCIVKNRYGHTDIRFPITNKFW